MIEVDTTWLRDTENQSIGVVSSGRAWVGSPCIFIIAYIMCLSRAGRITRKNPAGDKKRW